MEAKIVELIVQPRRINGDPIGELTFHVTQEDEIFPNLMRCCTDNHGKLASIILVNEKGEKQHFLKKTNGQIFNIQGFEVHFYQRHDLVLGVIVSKPKEL